MSARRPTRLQWLRSAAGAVGDLIYPPVCPLCKVSLVDGPAVPKPCFCAKCKEELSPKIEHSCQRCGAPVGPYVEADAGCIHCRDDRFAFEEIIRLNVYQEQLRSACLRAKNDESLAAALAGLLYEQERKSLTEMDFDIAVPVPAHWWVRWRRRQNTAETIAKVLARRIGCRFSQHLMVKTKHTPPQASLSPTQRRKNLRGVFRVRRTGRHLLRGRSVLIVDDVLTTGSTAHQMARTITECKPSRITVAVIGRGIGAP